MMDRSGDAEADTAAALVTAFVPCTSMHGNPGSPPIHTYIPMVV